MAYCHRERYLEALPAICHRIEKAPPQEGLFICSIGGALFYQLNQLADNQYTDNNEYSFSLSPFLDVKSLKA